MKAIKINTEVSYETHNEITIDPTSTCLQGYVEVAYKVLVREFGKPMKGDGYKVDAQWIIKFSDSKIATIYNYKDGKNYNGASGTPKTKITDWHIGGFDKDVVERIRVIIGA